MSGDLHLLFFTRETYPDGHDEIFFFENDSNFTAGCKLA